MSTFPRSSEKLRNLPMSAETDVGKGQAEFQNELGFQVTGETNRPPVNISLLAPH